MPFIDSTTGPHAFEGLGGARYFDMDVEVKAAGTTVSTGGKQEWLNPIISLRYIWQISEKWRLSLRGDIGGFGIGDASDFAWNAVGLIGWQPWKHVGFLGGYQALDVDYETGSGINKFKFDMLMHGPLLAVNITW